MKPFFYDHISYGSVLYTIYRSPWRLTAILSRTALLPGNAAAADMHYFCATCQSGHPEDRPKTQSILWKDIVRGSQITAALKEEQIKKGNEKTSASGVILRYQHLGFRVLFYSSGSTLRQWLPMAADSRHQLPLYNATQHCY